MRGSRDNLVIAVRSTTPRCISAGVALQACPVAHHREIPALRAGFADIALYLCFGAPTGGACVGRRKLHAYIAMSHPIVGSFFVGRQIPLQRRRAVAGVAMGGLAAATGRKFVPRAAL